MINTLESYAKAGKQAGRAFVKHDFKLAESQCSWKARALRLEAPGDRIAAGNAFADAYRAETASQFRFLN